MCRIASLFLLQRLKGSMSGDARDFKHRDASCHQVAFPAKQGVEGNSRHSEKKKLGEHAPSYATVKNWVAQFKRDDFSTCDAPRPGRPKTVTTPEIIDRVYSKLPPDDEQ